MICGLVALLGGMFSACSHNEPVEKTDLIDCDKPIFVLINAIELYDAEGNNLLSKGNPNNWLDRDIYVRDDNGIAQFELKEGAEDVINPLMENYDMGYILTQCYDYIYGTTELLGPDIYVHRFLRRNADDYALYIPPSISGEINIAISLDSPDSAETVVLSTELIDGEKGAIDYNVKDLGGKACVVTECSVPYEMSYRVGETSVSRGNIIFANIKLTLQ